MTIEHLRAWMAQYQQADKWWLAFSTGTHPEPVTLDQVEQVLAQHPQESISLLHVDQAAAGSTEWVPLSTPAAAAATAVAATAPAAAPPVPALRAARRPGAGRRTGHITRQVGATEADAASGRPGFRKRYGGLDRLLYFINNLVLAFLVMLCVVFAFTQVSLLALIIAAVILPVGQLFLMWFRIKNIGWSPWYSLLAIIPLLGAIVSLLAIALPEGFADSRKLDTAAIVIFSLVAAFLLFSLAVAIMQPAWLDVPHDELFD